MGIATGVSSSSGDEGGLLSGYGAFLEAAAASQAERYARINGHAEGLQQGYDQGFGEGQRSGYDQGWADGINRGNRELMKMDGYMKVHIADKERLQQTVNEQAQQIAQLMARIEAMDGAIGQKDDAMRVIQDSQLPQMARELKAENDQLRAQVETLQTHGKAKAQECTDKALQVNRVTTVLNAMRKTLEALTADKASERTVYIEHLFCENFKKEVATGLEKGCLREPLELDALFAKTMPATHRFVMSILQSVNERIELDQRDHDADPNWVPDGA